MQLVSRIFIQLRLANDVTGNHRLAVIKMAGGGGKRRGRMDPGSVGTPDPFRDSLREEEALEGEPEEAPDASHGNSSRKQIVNAGDELEAAPAICKGSSIRGGSEGHAKALTITGVSIGNSEEEEEFSPQRESRQEQQEGPQRSRALTLNTENSKPHAEELQGTQIGMLWKGEKRGSTRLIEEVEMGEGKTRAGGHQCTTPNGVPYIVGRKLMNAFLLYKETVTFIYGSLTGAYNYRKCKATEQQPRKTHKWNGEFLGLEGARDRGKVMVDATSISEDHTYCWNEEEQISEELGCVGNCNPWGGQQYSTAHWRWMRQKQIATDVKAAVTRKDLPAAHQGEAIDRTDKQTSKTHDHLKQTVPWILFGNNNQTLKKKTFASSNKNLL
ncbi:hypothetical protein Y1Q_0019327 [Alligator mississippiensis]|uniref:Uncharacterized protein n=1 Tax=Alligator mississippiensis TaxID=8496 RepID=A0A151MR56_ALLMI|nr:hypothetical protein Y1Q_0019327 [Alligator mississippiensis]